jgi:hypothetical protein
MLLTASLSRRREGTEADAACGADVDNDVRATVVVMGPAVVVKDDVTRPKSCFHVRNLRVG